MNFVSTNYLPVACCPVFSSNYCKLKAGQACNLEATLALPVTSYLPVNSATQPTVLPIKLLKYNQQARYNQFTLNAIFGAN